MSSVQNTRSSFFPNSRTQNERAQDVQKQSPIKRNSTAQKAYIDNQTSRDAKVTK